MAGAVVSALSCADKCIVPVRMRNASKIPDFILFIY
jgi:hypothetical protein